MLPSEGSKSSTHHLGDKNRFDVSSKGPSSGISVLGGGGGGSGKARVFLYKCMHEYIKTTRDQSLSRLRDISR